MLFQSFSWHSSPVTCRIIWRSMLSIERLLPAQGRNGGRRRACPVTLYPRRSNLVGQVLCLLSRLVERRSRSKIINASPTTLGDERQLLFPWPGAGGIVRLLQVPPKQVAHP